MLSNFERNNDGIDTIRHYVKNKIIIIGDKHYENTSGSIINVFEYSKIFENK